MERWKELLTTDLNSVAKGWEEVGKDAARLETVIEQIPAAARHDLVKLMNDVGVNYFAGKLQVGDYDKMAELEAQQKAGE